MNLIGRRPEFGFPLYARPDDTRSHGWAFSCALDLLLIAKPNEWGQSRQKYNTQLIKLGVLQAMSDPLIVRISQIYLLFSDTFS